ncbi:MAG: hypothetical protein AB7O39_06300 [Flavobacteriaceae bacterium]
MGSVLEFKTPDRRGSGNHCSIGHTDDHDAEIILFPGIRIEYQTIDLAHRPGESEGQGRAPGGE